MSNQPPIEERPLVPRAQDPRNPLLQLRRDWQNWRAELRQFMHSAWPNDAYNYPEMFQLCCLLIQPRLVLSIAHFLLAARRNGLLIFGFTCRGSFGAQRPSCYVGQPQRWRRWLRFLRECVLPTIFVKPASPGAVGGYRIEGYEFSLYVWLIGRSWDFEIGERGPLLYEPPPPADEPPDWFMPDREPELRTCPVCGGFRQVAYLTKDDDDPLKLTIETLADFKRVGAFIEDCDNCEGMGQIEVDDDDEPDCFPLWGGGYSTTGH